MALRSALFASVFVLCGSLKVLMYNPSMGHSHMAFQGAIADILIDAGHTVHMVIPDWNPKLLSNGTTRAQRIYRFSSSAPTKYTNSTFHKDPFDANYNLAFNLKEFENFANTTNQFCDDILKNDLLLDELHGEQYDVVISELYEFCNWGWFHGIGIKTKIIISATPMTHLISYFYGIPTPYSYVPNVFNSQPNAPKLTLAQKANNMFFAALSEMFTPTVIAEVNKKLQKKFGSNFPDVSMIVQNTSIALINANDVLDLPKPMSSKIVNVGGIAIKKPTNQLRPEIKAIFNKAKKGVVLFSFGSIADTRKMKPFMKTAFLNSFAAFPEYEFIWKFSAKDANESSFLENYRNVHPVEWMDQTTILAQSNLRAFITHCGLNSLTESAYAGKPMIALPLFADQNYNAAIVVQRRIGVFVDIRTITEDKMTKALEKVLHSDDFHINAQKLSRKLLTHPHNPRIDVLKWVEYATEFGDLHENFNLEAANLDLFRYLCFDVLFPAISFLIVLVFVLLKLISFTVKTLTSLWSAKKKID